MTDRPPLRCLIDELNPEEIFLVRSLRYWATGKRDGSIAAWATVWRLFQGALGEADAAEAVSGFQAMMAAINRAACRTIHHHTPDCPCLDEDEVAIVRLVAALAHGAVEEARAIALGLVRPEGVTPLLVAAGGLARSLIAAGHVPTLRAVVPLPPGARTPEPVTPRRLH